MGNNLFLTNFNMIIIQIIKEAQLHKIPNLIKFIFACFKNIFLILRDRTILTLPFKYPLKINTIFGYKKIFNYYEIPFYTYNYSFLLNLIPENSLLLDI
ncbi:TPA: hypothetical protein DCZ31_05305 [Patescibacteria group bacterium]|nr:hypothetical protein [Candidatus Gracilibacteria bacterium]